MAHILETLIRVCSDFFFFLQERVVYKCVSMVIRVMCQGLQSSGPER